jgi:hypothetical protein
MGWTGIYRNGRDSTADLLRHELTLRDSADPGAGVQDIALVGRNTAYVAYRQPGPGAACFAIVMLLRYSRDELMFKDMDEFMGPNESDCPKRILDLLTPIDPDDDRNGYARAWRERCRANLERRAVARELEPGDVIRFPQPFSFSDGTKLRSFVVDRPAPRKPLRLHAIVGYDDAGRPRPSSFSYRLSNWRTRAFERLTPAEAYDSYQKDRTAALTESGWEAP